MRQLIEDKIMDIEQKMDAIKTRHLYYLTEQWKMWVAQIEVLNELLQSKKR